MTMTRLPIAQSSHAATAAERDVTATTATNAHANATARANTTNIARRAPTDGLYRADREHDACGVGFIADIHNKPTHSIIEQGLQILVNLTHRGAVGADPEMGDGAGMLVQLPHEFFAEEAARLGFSLPAPGEYAVGMVFLPKGSDHRAMIEGVVAAEGQRVLGWREVPVNSACLPDSVLASEPEIVQFFIGRGEGVADATAFERRLFILRKVISNTVYDGTPPADRGFVICSLSCRTIVYKGMFLAHQLGEYYHDLQDKRFASALALVHQRFSTNTFPSWGLAHPYRMVAHNGEINTLRGNVNWMAARQASASSKLFGEEISKLWPISYEGQSDTACFDNALEFLVQGGYSLAHAMAMLVPEAWAGNPLMDDERRAFYEYHAALMEPWDGPAAIVFTDGRQIGATLDRNGLRPARYCITHDGLVIMGSEAGVLPVEEERIAKKWRLQPGRMLLLDLEQHRIVSDEEVKHQLATSQPYGEWLEKSQIVLEDQHPVRPRAPRTNESLLDRQQSFGYTQEDLKLLLSPMAITGQEALGSMGTDTPLSVLSDRSKLLYTYFKQNFAQVTNPPIDPIREELVMSLVSFIGPRPNLFDIEGLQEKKRLEVRQPILTNDDLEKIREIGDIADNHFHTKTLDITYSADRGAPGMAAMLERLCERAEKAVHDGYNIIVLSDRLVSRNRIAIPALLATAGVHHHLIRKGLRTSVGLVVESGEPREVHHFCVLAGYGAEAINPYLAFETLVELHTTFPEEVDEHEVVARYIKSLDKGILKVMSKMGISTYQSYCGAQIFDAVGLSQAFVDRFFFGTATTIEGVGLEEVAEETVRRHTVAFSEDVLLARSLDVGGEYAYRTRGEHHMWLADTVANLQHAVRLNAQEKYDEYSRLVNEEAGRYNVRGLFRIKDASEFGATAIPIEEVEPASEIVKRFVTGAMSLGAISKEAHETLALAMNQIGGRSNTGEGGEDPMRFIPLPSGASKRSAIKQVASGRFGVTTEYLVNADQIQIKVAQGAKPGEGGQLPGHKVDAVIAKLRYSTPGVGLISPPPHHDIYSIEDLAQLIFDLKNVNPAADISVKLVSEVGVGTVAAGVAKARADHITIAGYDGGTGASPLTSIKHAGSPWEMGLAETHQTLVANGLRSRVALQVDGGLKTGRDVFIGALLGADEFGFSTAPLVATGCIMMRKCHLNTCPVGVATQDPVLRRRFKGQPEHVINFMFFVAEELRRYLAAAGFRSLAEATGHVEVLDQTRLVDHYKAKGLDFRKVFVKMDAPADEQRHTTVQIHPIETVLDRELIAQARPAIEDGEPVTITMPINSVDRTAGAMISGVIAKAHGMEGLPDGTVTVNLTGTAGQSFGAWLAQGVTLNLTGDANDYVGKGLCGGRIIVRPRPGSHIIAADSIIVGNTVLYGAVSGECYFAGVAGERFAVRNSGAVAVVEGVGDHGCEYMTGGVVAVLGHTGRNFAAGMSGGVAYVLDEAGDFARRCNLAMVELEPVAEEDDLLERLHHHGGDLETKGRVDVTANMTRHDDERLRQLIVNHVEYTGSVRGKLILDHWDEYRPKFVKVMPVDYRRAMDEMESQRLGVAAE
ncbi:glutamate synthase large subunit [Acuticoccus kandeliae]|uniref:glutamate synthase large subunit n=1 Tax=Acuticoccus kandeliae TaxID=2073160 RepID=UPI000D3E738E|nr:glutamate synthase large subunit [Acuticoccus kandeliae]